MSIMNLLKAGYLFLEISRNVLRSFFESDDVSEISECTMVVVVVDVESRNCKKLDEVSHKFEKIFSKHFQRNSRPVLAIKDRDQRRELKNLTWNRKQVKIFLPNCGSYST
eukprot:TRINITY_DN1416_c0_g3_i1.p1 TRINITY_DN1416_c0_g3~~TRINITY_DN1416_c0_g3_i1.p1  ORF type:complete len:110 (-),score=4.32 TRINITY_DN1416_c0_g3_i1:325-654(-)